MQAAPEDRELLRALRWYDGFVIALANPGFLIGFLGYSIGALGGWAAVTLWAISMLIGTARRERMQRMLGEWPGGDRSRPPSGRPSPQGSHLPRPFLAEWIFQTETKVTLSPAAAHCSCTKARVVAGAR